MEQATLGAGCFWCIETIFKELRGVQTVDSGYSGGDVENHAYKDVSSGSTGHAEVVQVTFDPGVISYEQLLDIFWYIHDPTTLNRQGADVGTQYRSVIFYHSNEQKEIAEKSKQNIDQSSYYPDPIVTAIEPFEAFYKAEDYHQDFYENNPNQPYCRIVIDPKLKKLREQYSDHLKEQENTP